MQQTSAEVLRVTVTCSQCEVESDGVVQQGTDFFVPPGTHRLIGHWSGNRSRDASVEGAAGQTQSVSIEEPPQSAAVATNTTSNSTTASTTTTSTTTSSTPEQPRRGGLSPAFFIGGLAATAIVGGVAIWSWIDATSQGNQLIQNAMSTHMRDPAREAAVQSAETRTIILDGVTAGVGAISVGVLIATLVTRNSGASERRVSVTATPGINGYTGLSVTGAF